MEKNMDFLNALEKATELGLSKDEFLPIYMKEIRIKTDQLAYQNSGCVSWCNNSDERASSVWSSTSRPQSTWPEWKPQHDQKQSEQAVFDLNDLKLYLDNMKDSLSTQLQEFKHGKTLDSEQFKCVQQDMKHFLTQIHTDIQTSLTASLDSGFQKQDNGDTIYEMINKVLEKLNECMLAMKQNIERSQGDIVSEMYCIQSNLKDDYHKQVNRQDQQFLSQGTYITENYNNGQLTILQCHNELLTSIKELQSLVVGTFSKICEFQNNFSATMHQQLNAQQALLKTSANVCTAVTENLKKFKDGYQETQPEIQGKYFKLPLGVCTNDPGCGPQGGFDSIARGTTLANEYLGTSLENKIISMYESSAPTSGSIISMIYDICIQNVSAFLESRKEFQKVTYDEKLGCCLRASIYFSEDKETENILTVCLDICQVGQDVVLPDLLRILSELTLINRVSDFSHWNIAKEKGVFYLPKLRETGWFEVCAVFLDLQSSEFKDFVHSGTLSFYYNITVFNREVDRKQEQHKDLSSKLIDPGFDNKCDSSEDSYDSDSECSQHSEYFDADAEENREVTHKRKSLESSASTQAVDASMLQPTVEHEITDPLTAQAPCSTYFLPISAFNALVGSESVVDSQDWYLHFLGHSIHAVLAFLDDDTMAIYIDYFHGTLCADLPEVAIYRCCVSLVDQTDRMEDLVIAESVQVFDLTADRPADWVENCVCIFSCRTIKGRFKNNGRIVLQFDFFDMN